MRSAERTLVAKRCSIFEVVLMCESEALIEARLKSGRTFASLDEAWNRYDQSFG